MSKQKDEEKMEKIVSFCKSRGFIFQSSEIYGGIAGIYDYGPLGVELKRNLKDLFWQKFVRKRDDMVGMDAGIIMNPKVWQASGHTGEGFADVLYECKKCHKRFRDDEIKNNSSEAKATCPTCGSSLADPQKFNILVKTFLGPVENSSVTAYLRGETAQGMFVNFRNVLDSTRRKVPFGIAQIGKAFRNEITPKNFTFRIREFEQAEIEYFVEPEKADKYFNRWVKIWQSFFLEDLGLDKDKLHLEVKKGEDLAHYADANTDLEYDFPFGKKELAGIANRTDFDLKNHQKHCGVDMSYFDQEKKEKYYPFVIEPTLGIDRAVLAMIVNSFDVVGSRGKDDKNEEIVLRLPRKLAPYKAAIFPLVKKDKIKKLAKEIYIDLNSTLSVFYDESGSIGRRYRRQDEIGTPYCITVDFNSLDDNKVTVRDRDTMKQDRIEIKKLQDYLNNKI